MELQTQNRGKRSEEDPPQVTIVMVGKNEEAYVGRGLEGIFSQKNPPPLEVLFIDSGSTDATLPIVSSFPVRLVQIAPEEFHHARTRNLGARLARGETVVFLNADAVPLNEVWLSELLRPLQAPHIVATYSRHLPRPDASKAVRLAHETTYGTVSEVHSASDYDRLGMRIFFFSTVSAAVRKDFLLATPFSEKLGIFEDRYLALQIIRQGYAVAYCAESLIEHSHNIPPGPIFRRYFDLGFIDNLMGIHEYANGRSQVGIQAVGHLRYALRSLSFKELLKDGPEILLNGSCRFMGYLMGKHHRFLPPALVRWISLYQKEKPEP